MRNPVVLLLLFLTSSAFGFIAPQRPSALVTSQAKPSSTELMSSIDLARYAVGNTDEFKGTGVFSAIEFKRENNGDGADTKPAAAQPAKKEKSKETVPK